MLEHNEKQSITGMSDKEANPFETLVSLMHGHRIGFLATVDSGGASHLVPICFVAHATAIYSAIDHKPKQRTGYRMKRIRNILANPRVAFLIQHYEEDWEQLYYVMVRGPAEILEEGVERSSALILLEEKYLQYRQRHLAASNGLVVKIVPEIVQHWSWKESSRTYKRSHMSTGEGNGGMVDE